MLFGVSPLIPDQPVSLLSSDSIKGACPKDKAGGRIELGSALGGGVLLLTSASWNRPAWRISMSRTGSPWRGGERCHEPIWAGAREPWRTANGREVLLARSRTSCCSPSTSIFSCRLLPTPLQSWHIAILNTSDTSGFSQELHLPPPSQS